VPPTSIEAPGVEASSKLAEVRRRIRDHYYDRPEVRRMLTHRILRKLARRTAPDRVRP
jgi:hypothetical protein